MDASADPRDDDPAVFEAEAHFIARPDTCGDADGLGNGDLAFCGDSHGVSVQLELKAGILRW
ncbi:hypothetical protein [Ottowia sp.]|uniref:hypothetical protein n=1 Tax=Ottowia sp. TaxID=1898956 RepID=UPI0025F69E07|nr:hypothetical protein [Ottowia sp.]